MHDRESDNATKARSYANAVAAKCEPMTCEVMSTRPHLGQRLEGSFPRSGRWQRRLCAHSDPSPRGPAAAFLGFQRWPAEARNPKPAAQPPEPGPDWWDTTTAEDNLMHSKWVFDHKINDGVFSCVG